MTEEFQQRTYSMFWPVLIFMAAFALSCFYQLAQLLEQRDTLSKRYTAEAVNLPKAQEAQNRLVALMNDLVTTGAKDPNAAQIIQEAKAAGIIHEKQNAAAAPASTP
jgi:hypothetical protein